MTDTITMPREVAKRILRNIEIGNKLSAGIEMRREIEAALERPQGEQEPICWVTGYYGGHCTVAPCNGATVLPVGMALYTRPQPKRQPLTNEQVKAGLIDSIDFADQRERCAFNLGVRFAERAHGIGGGA